jgi:hypothetical protein
MDWEMFWKADPAGVPELMWMQYKTQAMGFHFATAEGAAHRTAVV